MPCVLHAGGSPHTAAAPIRAPSPAAQWPFGALCLDYCVPIGLISPRTYVCQRTSDRLQPTVLRSYRQHPGSASDPQTDCPWSWGCVHASPNGCKQGVLQRAGAAEGGLGWGQRQQHTSCALGSGFLHTQQGEKDGEALPASSRGCNALLIIPCQWLLLDTSCSYV